MKKFNTSSKQNGFLEIGAGLLILALFGGTAAVVAPDETGKAYASIQISNEAPEDKTKED